MTRRLLLLMTLLAAPAMAAGGKTGLTGSKHDFGVTGGGPVRSSVTDSCMFCHAPHNVMGNVTPLWDHQLSTQTYTTYSSTTYNSGAQAPAAGSSKLCLSCHDGTVAVGLTVSHGSIATTGSLGPAAIFGTNLSSDHPVGMLPVDDGQLVSTLFNIPPSTKDPAVTLSAGRVECGSCHDPHTPNNDATVPKFLARSNSNGQLCLACHEPGRPQPNQLNGWTTGAHATFTNTVPTAAGVGPYGTVAANACSSCHLSHRSPVSPRNLKAAEESACATCHNGTTITPALRNVMGEFSKTYRHPTTTVSGAHEAAETLPVNNARHAECADCHNSHAAAAQAGTALPPATPASMLGVSGYGASGAVRPAGTEYQICFKCHADSTNKPQNSTYAAYGRTPSRYPQGTMPTGYPTSPPLPADQYNTRLQFSGSIGHNVTGSSVVTTGNTTLRPFMLNNDGTSNTSRPLTTSSQLFCSDCHNNDQARAFKGSGPNGAHGSSFAHLLQQNLYQEPAGGGSGNTASGYALCNKCHNLTNLNNIRPHDPHMSYGCTTCHDPHGVIGGSAAANRAMINFDTAIVSKATTSFGYFYLSSTNKGCYVTCHGKLHNPITY